ncbi:hypothetical protein LSAT2_012618 [Lamellibrachia satsuma]|nr:hypothetical protein LSAT2_012618 [Lamellibrachia satsuma]
MFVMTFLQTTTRRHCYSNDHPGSVFSKNVRINNSEHKFSPRGSRPRRFSRWGGATLEVPATGETLLME